MVIEKFDLINYQVPKSKFIIHRGLFSNKVVEFIDL